MTEFEVTPQMREFQQITITDAAPYLDDGIVPPSCWHRDHFNAILVLADIAVNSNGDLEQPKNDRRLRVDGMTNPTRIITGNTTVDGHSDYDCLNDAIRAGVFVVNDDNNIELTELGGRVVGELFVGKQNRFTEYVDLEGVFDDYADYTGAEMNMVKVRRIDEITPDLADGYDMFVVFDAGHANEAVLIAVDTIYSIKATGEYHAVRGTDTDNELDLIVTPGMTVLLTPPAYNVEIRYFTTPETYISHGWELADGGDDGVSSE